MSFLISQSAASVGECEVAMTRAVELLSCWLRSWLPGGPLSRDIRQSLMRLLTTCGPLEAPWGRAGAREVVRAVLCDQALTRMEMDAGGGHHPGQCHQVNTAEMSTSCSGDANNRVSQTLLALQVRRLVTAERSGLEELIVTQVDQASFEPLTRLLLHPKVSDGPVISSARLPFTIGARGCQASLPGLPAHYPMSDCTQCVALAPADQSHPHRQRGPRLHLPQHPGRGQTRLGAGQPPHRRVAPEQPGQPGDHPARRHPGPHPPQTVLLRLHQHLPRPQATRPGLEMCTR